MKNSKNNKILIATGGTGGHVFPAYSLAKYLTRALLELFGLLLLFVFLTSSPY